MGWSSGVADQVGATDHGALTGLADDDHTAYASNAELTTHESDTSSVHGVTDTTVLETTTGSQAKVDTHSSDTTSVHGITNTANVALKQTVKFTRRTASSLTLNSTTWTNLDTGMDLVLAAAVGDVIECSLNGGWNNEAVNANLDVVTVVSAAAVNSFGDPNQTGLPADTDRGVQGWSVIGSLTDFQPLTGSIWKTMVSGDLSAGTVTLRLRYRTDTAANKTLFAVGTNPLVFAARNLGPVDAS